MEQAAYSFNMVVPPATLCQFIFIEVTFDSRVRILGWLLDCSRGLTGNSQPSSRGLFSKLENILNFVTDKKIDCNQEENSNREVHFSKKTINAPHMISILSVDNV